MKSEKFQSFLLNLGFQQELLNKDITDSFSYSVALSDVSLNTQQSLTVDYCHCTNKEDLFNYHISTWNRNEKSSFVAIFDDKTYLIDARFKPDKENLLPNRIIIKLFDYGINTTGYNIAQQLHLITKEGVDNAYYFNFVIEHQKRKKATEVDKDLLLNLLELRNDLVTKQNEEIIHLLLLRCLFVKYLEDRGVFEQDYLYNVLATHSAEKLISAFRKVRKINGDLFKNSELRAEDLTQKCLNKLSLFFGYSDYRSKQGKFFPYQFDKIPIQLISSIYESFLKEETKKGNGVYYTPSFLVNFMLAQTLGSNQKSKSTVLDPACGSGAFLVEAFRLLIKYNKAENKYEKKKTILQNQLFGIDLDPRALQIAAFSLYLALLEGEDPEFIREKIRTESPILPSLIGKTLIKGNALTDDILFEVNNLRGKKTFDCVVANPPWGSVPEDEDGENIKTREAIGNKSQSGTIPSYNSVSDFQRSQAFLLRTKEWGNKDGIASIVVNNSIFLNENAENFRKDFLNNYQLENFYELADINKILFKKHKIGEINNKPVEIGANEPCCVLIYKMRADTNKAGTVKYINPKLNDFTENLNIIAYSSKDVIEIQQNDLAKEDILWRIFVNGKWEDYQLIKKRILEKDERITIECHTGFQPQKNMKSLGVPKYETLIEQSDFRRYNLPAIIDRKFNWNQKLRRKGKDESIFEGKRIIIPVRPLASDELRFRAVRLEQRCVYRDDILAIKIKKNGKYIFDYAPYLAILNSKFLGYLYYQISSQWGKGDAKRSTLRNSHIQKLPFPLFEESEENIKRLSELVNSIEKLKSAGKNDTDIENEIDDLVFDLYNLTDYERAIINDFYEVFYSRKNHKVTPSDVQAYSSIFMNVLKLMLSDGVAITSSYKISNTIGAVVCFALNNKDNNNQGNSPDLSDIMHIVKKNQTERSYLSYALTEEKVKYYDKQNLQFFIIKSNLYKDWTVKQAIDDANEEISNLINHLKK